MSAPTRLPRWVRWTADDAGRATIQTRQEALHGTIRFVGLLGFSSLSGLAVGIAEDDMLPLAGIAAFAGGFGLFSLLGAKFLPTAHTLLIHGESVTHQWRSLIGITHEAPVSGLLVLSTTDDGENGPLTQLAAHHADETPTLGLWTGDLPDLVKLGEELHARTGLPFDPDPDPDPQRPLVD